jgi:transcriptional regulator with XRE-family HTH domain
MAQSTIAPGRNRHRDEQHVRSLQECLLWEIALAMKARGLSDADAAAVTGERIETLQHVLRGRNAAYGIVRLMRALARLGVPVSLSVTPASTMLRAGERRQVIRYRTGRQQSRPTPKALI